ncbi:MAG TPA: type II/IV secretion system ATPase subunit, partial [Methanocorpusculum sp.]|nr:type II/IV secretion system ATPase subunit [Methanocorpusculum sp.]
PVEEPAVETEPAEQFSEEISEPVGEPAEETEPVEQVLEETQESVEESESADSADKEYDIPEYEPEIPEYEPEIPEYEPAAADSATAAAAGVAAGAAAGSAKHAAKKKKKSSLSLSFKKKEEEKPPLPEYDMERDGPLVTPVYEEGDTVRESYWAIPGLCHISIVLTKEYEIDYRVQEPNLTEFEHTLLERLDEGIRDILILRDIAQDKNKKQILYEAMDTLLKEYRIDEALQPESVYRIRYYLERTFFGWGRIDALRCDYDLEDISCDGYGSHVFIYHREYRDMKTSIKFDNPKELDNLVASFAQKAGKHISLANPIVDASLSDGSRIQLTYSTVVSAHGSSFTIRKFKPTPFSPVELLKKGTFTTEELAYLWIAVENGKSIMVIGGTASGKTTTLNAISQFIPRLSKVVSIEDTREITLDHENWIASVVPPETPGKENKNDIQMFDLLKAAMRQRPEYILVGEVRGVESQTLFQAINTGHTTFSTMHASDVVSAINRLTNPPLDVPKATIQALDLVVAQARYYKDGAPYRRLKEVVEIVGLSEQGGIEVNTAFSYDPATDETAYSGNSKIYKDIMMSKNLSNLHMQDELRRRIQLLDAMLEQEVYDYRDVGKVIWIYRSRPDLIMENIADLSAILNEDMVLEDTMAEETA